MARTHTRRPRPRRRRAVGLVVALLAVGLLTTAAQAAPSRGGNRRHAQRKQRRHHDPPQRASHRDRGHFRGHDDRLSISLNLGGNYRRPGHHGRPWRHLPYRRGKYVTRWVEPVYATHYDRCGRPTRILVTAGYYTSVWVPHRKARFACRAGCDHRQHQPDGLVIRGKFRF